MSSCSRIAASCVLELGARGASDWLRVGARGWPVWVRGWCSSVDGPEIGALCCVLRRVSGWGWVVGAGDFVIDEIGRCSSVELVELGARAGCTGSPASRSTRPGPASSVHRIAGGRVELGARARRGAPGTATGPAGVSARRGPRWGARLWVLLAAACPSGSGGPCCYGCEDRSCADRDGEAVEERGRVVDAGRREDRGRGHGRTPSISRASASRSRSCAASSLSSSAGVHVETSSTAASWPTL